MNNDDLELRKAFFNESIEILDKLNGDIAAMEAEPENVEFINTVFRGLHTIKGNSSFLNLENITKISHAAETLLDKARKKEVKISKNFVTIVKRVFSDLTQMIGEQETNLPIDLPVTVIEEFLLGNESVVRKIEQAIDLDPSPSAVAPTLKIQTGTFVRVDESKISKILTLATELELLRHAFEKIPEKLDLLGPIASELHFDLDMQVSKLSRLTRSLSSIVFGVRLVPVNQVFQRFPRVVSELAQKLNKKIQLKIENGSAELDKAIVEAIADPMTHLIRNSADHGIENVEDRLSKGKSEAGTITLNSYVKGNFVFIDITDDGKGIDGDLILRKAVEKGIVPKDKAKEFTQYQKLGLIFAPGFSTAEKVTDISGRGVGMDVVKSNINKLKGTVIIDSTVNKGTTIQLRFPMSMVVMFSLFVKVDETNCALPVSQIEESIDFSPAELLTSIPTGEDVSQYYRVYSLRSLLWKEPVNTKRKVFHTLRFKDLNGRPFVFLVDDFLSIEEAIVQSVDSYVSALPGIQGATVQKDGSVALVVNTDSVLDHAEVANAPFAFVKKRKAVQSELPAGLSDFLDLSSSA
jgi:two-component system, chemotaxis family, sensor kinase CheA